MIIIAVAIFAFCTWAVFSKHFCDGIVTKHFLTFAAILSALVILNPENTLAGVVALLLFITGMAYWVYKHREALLACLTDLGE